MKRVVVLFALLCLVLVARVAFPQETIERMVVFDFDLVSNEVSRDEGLTLSDYIRTSFIATGSFDVVSREQLDRVFKEHEFQMSGLTEESNAIRIGKILNIKNAIMGTIGKFGQTYIINIKLLDLETGKYLAGEEVRAKNKDDALDQIKEKVQIVAGKVSLRGQETPGNDVEGEWIADSDTGCRVWNPQPVANESISWSGGCANGKANGTGVLIWFENGKENGRTEGEFRNGFPKRAISTSPNGDRYEGEYLNWKKHGNGVLTLADGRRYDGHWAEGNITKGVLYLVDGARYEGTFRGFQMDGKGLLVDANGNTYEGEFKNGALAGIGVLTWATGDRYEGSFENSRRTGRGLLTSANGDRYDGEWVQDKRSGKGTCYFANGDRYEGQWVEDKRSGYGTYYDADGSRYVGQWSSDIATGGWVYDNKGNRVWGYQDKDGTWHLVQQEAKPSTRQPEKEPEQPGQKKTFTPAIAATGFVVGFVLGVAEVVPPPSSDYTSIENGLGLGSVLFLAGLILDGLIYLSGR